MHKLLTTLLAAGVSLLALVAPAQADPATIGSFILVNLLPGLIGTGIGAATVGSIAIGLGLTGLQLAVGLATRQKIKPQEYKSTFNGGDESSEIRAVGRVRLGGLKAFGNTKDLNRYRLICHVKGPVSQIERYYLGGREVTVEPNGDVSSPPWSFISIGGGGGLSPGDTSSNVNIKTKIGDGTETVWTDLATDFPLLCDSDFRLRGIAQSLVKYISPGISSERFLKLFQSLPDVEVVLRADAVYDPRDEAQAVDTPATWAWTENGILNAVHILRSYPSFTSDDFDWVGIAEQADLADATVETLTGTEPRARCSGVWPSESPRNDTMQQVLNSIGAEIVPGADHKILVKLIDDSPTPEIEYPAKHLEKLELRYGPEAVERPNLCIVKYYSPERKYEMAEIDLSGIAWARVQDEIDRYGEKPLLVDLPFCPSASQAQRNARRMFGLARADTGIATLNQTGMAAWDVRYASFEFPDIGEEGISAPKVCAIEAPRDNPDEPTFEIPFLVWPSLPGWNPEDDEAPAPDVLPDLLQPSDLTPPDQPIAAILVQYTDTTRELRVHATTPAGGTYVEVVGRLYDAEGPTLGFSMTEIESAGTFDTAWRAVAYQLFSNTSFSTGWTNMGSNGWTSSPPFAVATAGVQSAINQSPGLVSGLSYEFGITVSDRTAGSIRPRLGGGSAVEGTDISANGRFTQVLVAGAGSTTANFRKDASFAGKLSLPSLLHAGRLVLEIGDTIDVRKRIFDADGNASEWSPLLLVESLAISNTAPAAPTLTIGVYTEPGMGGASFLTYTITPTSLTAVRAEVEFTDDAGSSWAAFEDVDPLPLGPTLKTSDETPAVGKGFRVTLYSSNGTAGTPTTALYT